MIILKKITLFFWYLIASLIIICAVLGVSLKSLTPVINKHKDYIEHQIENILHVEIQIGHIDASWVRLGPELRFSQVVIQDHGRPVLKINKLNLNFDVFRTLWRRAIAFRYIGITGTDIVLRQTEPQHFLLNDVFDISLTDQDSTVGKEIVTWLIVQNRLRLADVHARVWMLNNTDASLQLSSANIYQTSQGISGIVEGAILAESLNTTESRILTGNVTVSLWANFSKNTANFFEAELQAQNIFLQDGKKKYSASSFGGILLWQTINDHWRLEANDIALVIDKTTLSRHFAFELMGFSDYYALHIPTINLSDLSWATNILNIAPKNLDLATANIQGNINDVDMVIPKDFSSMKDYQFSGVLNDVSSAAYQALPAMQHVSAVISGGITQGNFALLSKEDALDFSKYFNQAISVKNLFGSGGWHYAPEQFSLWLNSIVVEAPNVQAQGAMRLDIPLQQPQNTLLSLIADYHLTQSQDAMKYLPMKEFDADFSKWLTQAVVAGKGSDGKVLIRGTVNDFPYLHHNGTFIVDGSIKPLQFSISPEWPAINDVSGRLRFHNQAFTATATANFQHVNVRQANVSVPDYYGSSYGKSNPIVYVDLQARGDTQNYIRFIQASPLKSTLGAWLSPFAIQGAGDLSLHLELPVSHLDGEHIKASGSLLMHDADFTWTAFQWALKKLNGAIQFTQDSVTAKRLQAELEQEPVQIDLTTEKTKNLVTALHIDADGEMSVKQIETLGGFHLLSPYVSGKSMYHASLRVPFNSPDYLATLKSNLVGMKINLPENFGKTEKTALPFALDFSINPTADTAKLGVNYQKNINATVNIQHVSQEKNTQRTVQIDATATTFSWPLIETLPQASSSSEASFWDSLSSFTFHVSHLSLYKNNFTSSVISVTRQPTGFLWNMSANEAKGSVVVPKDLKHQAIKANFDYLTLAAQKNNATKGSSLSAKNAADWPEFFFNVQRFKYGTQNVGAVILHTSPLASGITFNDIQINNKLYQLSSHGQWINVGANDQTYLQGMFKTKNTGQFLKEANITQNFQAKAGSVNYNLIWPGSPMDFQLKSVEGDTHIEVKDGVIPVTGDAAKMGLGKVLSLFSTQSIQRRLQLNFSDLGQEGYSFNSLVSQLHFSTGNAMVKQGLFDGPEAKIAFLGRIGLAKQDYDVKLTVTPYVTSTLPLIATIAGGPIAGVATYAFDKIAESSIAKFTSYHYLLTGTWSQPKLIDLDAQAKRKAQAEQDRLDAQNVAPVSDAKN